MLLTQNSVGKQNISGRSLMQPHMCICTFCLVCVHVCIDCRWYVKVWLRYGYIVMWHKCSALPVLKAAFGRLFYLLVFIYTYWWFIKNHCFNICECTNIVPIFISRTKISYLILSYGPSIYEVLFRRCGNTKIYIEVRDIALKYCKVWAIFGEWLVAG